MGIISYLKNSELARGSLILIVTINIYNLLNYIFHFSMARMLSEANYGILAVLMSFIYIFAIPSETIQTLVSRYSSKFNIKKEYGRIKFLFYKSLRKISLFATIAFVFFVAISFFISYFLQIKVLLIGLTGLMVFSSFIFPISRGLLQGTKKFSALGVNMIIESVIKLACSTIFVIIGWQVYGAITGVIIGVSVAFILSIIPLNPIIKSKEKKTDLSGAYKVSVPYFIALFSIVLMYSLDIILARNFFSPDLAGKYAVASMLGKMIFFGTVPIGKAMFPIISERHDSGKDTNKIFHKALIIISGLCIIATLLLLIFPKIIIFILFGAKYLEISTILPIVGLSFSMLSITNLFLLYGLSTNRLKYPYLLPVFVLFQIVIFRIFNQDILHFSLAFLFSSIVMLISTIFLIRK